MEQQSDANHETTVSASTCAETAACILRVRISPQRIQTLRSIHTHRRASTILVCPYSLVSFAARIYASRPASDTVCGFQILMKMTLQLQSKGHRFSFDP
jgi:hypothetical protein